jgi:uncharacterized protein (TIGR02246 family)
MSVDERAIRDLVNAWMAASKSGDATKVLSLMAEDVVFMVPGQRPFGKEAFAAATMAERKFRLDGTSDIQEIKVLGDWAYLRNFITVTITPEDGSAPSRRSGFTLTILRKEAAGNWVLVRDANLMTAESMP